MYCQYYKAKIVKNRIWLVTGILKNEGPWAFDRTLDTKNDILEFFVAPDFEEEFLYMMNVFKQKNLVLSLEKAPNRLAT